MARIYKSIKRWVMELQQERFQAHSIDFKRRGHTYQNVWNSATLQIPNPWGTGVVLSS